MHAAPAAPEAAGFDYTSASIGGGVGIVAGYFVGKAIAKLLGRKRDDGFSRV